MPKSQFVYPEKIQQKGSISFDDVPLNQYEKSIKEEKSNYSKEEFLRIYRDMKFIREFEELIYNVRIYRSHKNIDFEYTGQGHLYTGQEAQAVGQAFVLDKNDFVFGTHRSHGEIIAKSLSCINQMTDKELWIMRFNSYSESCLIQTVQSCLTWSVQSGLTQTVELL